MPEAASRAAAEPPGPEMPFWITSLADFLALQPGVEALRLDPTRKSVALATLAPVDVAALQQKLAQVLELAQQGSAEAKLPAAEIQLGQIRLKQGTGGILLEKPSCPTGPRLWRWRDYHWPEAPDSATEAEWKTLGLQAALCGMSLLMGFLAEKSGWGPVWLPKVLYGISLLAGAWDAAQDSWEEIRRGVLDVHFLMLAVALGAVLIGAWTEGCLLLFLFSASGAIEHYALHRTHREIQSLAKNTPKTANLVQVDGSTRLRAVGLLEPGDIIRIKPDECFPADGVVKVGETTVDEANLTGESEPISKHPGANVYSGTLNQHGLVEIEITKAAEDSTVQNIIRLIHSAQQQRAPSQRFTDRFGTGYTLLVLGMTAVMFLVWWLAMDLPAWRSTSETKSAFYRAMALLVVASPCALVLSIPSAILAAIASGARRGILFKGGAAIEKLAEVDTVALDKTGTLTTGEMTVQSMESFPPGHELRLAEVACALEAHSNHPLARALVRHGKSRLLKTLPVTNFYSLAGKGVRGTVAGVPTTLGRRELLAAGPLREWIAQVPDAPLAQTEVWIMQEGLLGRILLQDQIREESREVMQHLKAANVRTIMLTGDRRSAAESVAKTLGVQEVRSGLKPEQKLAIITALSGQGAKVAMVGDGVNDAPSLAAAHVAVAMGGRGSDAALEQADVALMNDRIDKLVEARQLSLRASHIIRQNLIFSLGTVVVMVSASLLGQIPLTLGVIAHEGSTVLVCLNSLRLLFGKK
jgi:Cd2+/Zn2+-exporting ATPase